jgi:ubiquinone/menaquinone biosynthesis C-methylase UbiE
MPRDQVAQVDAGFSAKAAEYDALDKTHPVIMWMRGRIRRMVEDRLPRGGSILELNAGSGLDALYFAERGHRVHAIDVAAGMLDAAAAKAAASTAGSLISLERRSFTDLAGIDGAPFDLVLSDLGGLNCIEDLASVTSQLPGVLRPGGGVVLVVMPPVCPWEMAQALRGHFGTAVRRFKREGTLANVEGATVRTWYHAPGVLTKALGPRFRRDGLRSFCVFAPPSYFHGFVRRHPRLTQRLISLDDALGALPPFNRAGDFYALSASFLG